MFNESSEFGTIETFFQSKGINITYQNIFKSDSEFINNVLETIPNRLISQLSELGSFKVSVSAYGDFRDFNGNYQQRNHQLVPVMIKSEID